MRLKDAIRYDWIANDGLKSIEEVTYAGYTAVITSKYGDSYKIDYYGIGNMENIKTCFKEILSSFNG